MGFAICQTLFLLQSEEIKIIIGHYILIETVYAKYKKRICHVYN